MKCTEHDRTHCTEPRCHVLAVCWASVPDFDGQSFPTTWRRWAWLRDHGYQEEKRAATLQMAARLVAWMRTDGVICAADEAWGLFLVSYPEHQGDDDMRSMLFAAMERQYGRPITELWRHPLDAVMSHADRIAALASKCSFRGCRNGRHPPRVPSPLPIGPPSPVLLDGDPCDHDGVNWAALAALLDQMDAHGISLDAVHEWRPPS